MAQSILSLPPEILQEIAYKLDGDIRHANVKNLRAVNRYFCQAFDPIFFFYIKLDLGIPAPYLEQLARKEVKPCCLSRKLKIVSYAHYAAPRVVMTLSGQSLPIEEYLKKHLGPALSSFETVSELIWRIRDAEPLWTHKCVIESLSSHLTLSRLRLLIDGPMDRDFSKIFPLFRQFNNIRVFDARADVAYPSGGVVKHATHSILSSNSSHLDSLRLDSGIHESLEQDEFQDAFSNVYSNDSHIMPLTHLAISGWRLNDISFLIPHFRSLRSLRISQNQPFNLWTTFASEAIILEEIVVRDIDNTLLEYLMTYCGLVSFEALRPGNGLYQHNHKVLAEEFYESILLKHQASLKTLRFSSDSEQTWYFLPTYAKYLSQCLNLEEYAVGIERTEVRGTGADIISVLINAVDTLPRLQCLTILFPLVEGRNADMNTKVKIWNSIARATNQKKLDYEVHIQSNSRWLTYRRTDPK